MKKTCFIITFIPLLCINLYSQIQFEAGDFTKYSRAVGTYEQSTSGNVAVDLKQAGANITWDFSNLDMGNPIHYEYTFQRINGLANPYFPNANYMFIEEEGANPGWRAITYVKINDDSLQLLGKKMVDGADSSQSQHGSEYVYPLPLKYGIKWHSVRYDTMALWSVIENQKYFNEVDAYGKVKLPSGEYDCIRIRTSIIQLDGSYMGLKYYFFSKNYKILAIVTSLPNDSTYNFSNASGVEYYTGFTGITSQKYQKLRPEKFTLGQNYPNPFNPGTTIVFNLPDVVYGELAVFNVKGEKIKTLHHGRLLSGQHKVSWDGTDASGQQVAGGIYIYKFSSSKFSQSKRMILLK